MAILKSRYPIWLGGGVGDAMWLLDEVNLGFESLLGPLMESSLS
jgi:hypothetical protein